MRKNRIITALPWYAFYFFIILSSFSCVSNKNVVYFNNLPDTVKLQLDKLSLPAKMVQVNDVLEISVEIKQISNRSATVHQRVVRKHDQKLIAEADVTFAMVDNTTMKSVPIDDELRAMLTA